VRPFFPELGAIDRAYGYTLADIAFADPSPAFSVVVVLRSGGFKHGRTEVRRVFKRFGEGVVSQVAERLEARRRHVDVARVIPSSAKCSQAKLMVVAENVELVIVLGYGGGNTVLATKLILGNGRRG